jgi:hypothetical protein
MSTAMEKASKRLYNLIALRSAGIPSKILWRVYEAQVRSILLYGCTVWCNCSKGLWDKMEKIERRAIRIIQSSPPPTMPPLKKMADNICKRLVKEISRDVHHPLAEIVVKVENQYSSRRSQRFTSCWGKTSRFKNSLTRYCDFIDM